MSAKLQNDAQPPRMLPAPGQSPLEVVLTYVPEALETFSAGELKQLRGVSRTLQQTAETTPEWGALFAQAIDIPYAQLPLRRPQPEGDTTPQNTPRIDYFRMYKVLDVLQRQHGVPQRISVQGSSQTESADAPNTEQHTSADAPNTEQHTSADPLERVLISDALHLVPSSQVSQTHVSAVLEDYAQRLARTCPVDTKNTMTQWTSRLERDALITHLALANMSFKASAYTAVGQAFVCGVVVGLAMGAMRPLGYNLHGFVVVAIFVGCAVLAVPVYVGEAYKWRQDMHCLEMEHRLLDNLSDHACRGCDPDAWRPVPVPDAAPATAPATAQ